MAQLRSSSQVIANRPLEAGQSHSISVRKIENGFIVDTTSCDPDTGTYRSSTVYSANPPRITPPRVDARQVRGEGSSESLGDTMRYLSEDK